MNDDREVRCYALAVHHQNGQTPSGMSVADEVRKAWFALRDADDGCTYAAGRLLADPNPALRLSPKDVWRKARLAIDANRLRAASAAVELVAPDALGQLSELHSAPTKFLTAQIGRSKVRTELVVLALVRLAATDAEGAARMLEKNWASTLNAEERNWAWGAIGKQVAGRLGSDALSHFAKVSRDADLSDEMLAWKVRAALRAAATPKWPLVLEATEAMSEDVRKESTWVYWRARALKARAALAPPTAGTTHPDASTAAELLQAIASSKGFYEQLALEDLGHKITLPARPQALSTEERDSARNNVSLNRAIYAILVGLRPEGVREWNYATNLAQPGGMGDRALLAAAQFACEREVWDRCINTSERTRTEIDIEQRFPMPFKQALLQRTREIGLDAAYVYGLIRQESRFIMDARSHVGAAGLMQVMPATARWTARKIGLNSFVPEQINERDTNIAIGTGYLKLVLDDFDGSLALAAAAYNAGPSRPRNWRAPGGTGPVLEAAVWAENVPFNETRDYVKKVLANATVYAALISGQPQSLRARLGQIGPRAATAPEVNKDLP